MVPRTTSRSFPSDPKKAADFYKKACDLNQAPGCFELAGIYLSGQGEKKDVNRAVVLFQKACDL